MFTAFTEASLNMKGPQGCEMRWFRGEGWCSARRHNDIFEKALVWGAEYICILGPDQVHPEDLLIRLMDRVNQGFAIISAVVPMRGYVEGQGSRPFQPMAWRRDAETRKFKAIELEDGDIQSIDVIGSGVFMFPAALLGYLKRPWFVDEIDRETGKRKQLDDSLFVWRLRSELRREVYVDTTIKVKHANVFLIDETYQERFSDWVNGGGDPSICRYKEKVDVKPL